MSGNSNKSLVTEYLEFNKSKVLQWDSIFPYKKRIVEHMQKTLNPVEREFVLFNVDESNIDKTYPDGLMAKQLTNVSLFYEHFRNTENMQCCFRYAPELRLFSRPIQLAVSWKHVRYDAQKAEALLSRKDVYVNENPARNEGNPAYNLSALKLDEIFVLIMHSKKPTTDEWNVRKRRVSEEMKNIVEVGMMWCTIYQIPDDEVMWNYTKKAYESVEGTTAWHYQRLFENENSQTNEQLIRTYIDKKSYYEKIIARFISKNESGKDYLLIVDWSNLFTYTKNNAQK